MRSAAKHVERKGKGWRPQGNRDEKEAQGLRSRKKVRSSERNDNRKRSWHFKRTGETDKKSAQIILVQETSAPIAAFECDTCYFESDKEPTQPLGQINHGGRQSRGFKIRPTLSIGYRHFLRNASAL